MPGGTWTPYTLSCTAIAADAGKYIGVSFVTSKNSGKTAGTWAAYDDFYLTVVSIPVSPGGLAASAGNGQVILNWNPVANASGYYVKRSLVSGGSYTVVFTNLTGTTFTNIGLANGTPYYYVVSAFNQAGAGTNSTEVSAKPLPIPAVPTGLTAVATNGQIALQWNASTYAASYNIFRSILPGGYTPLTNNIASTNYTDGKAVPGTTYYYSVTATNGTGQSAFSSQAGATVPSPAFVAIMLSRTNFIVTGTNGTSGLNYLVLMSSNLALPSSNWTVMATNTFGPGGGFNFTNPMNSDGPQQFYQLKLP
jgi:cellulose 1,4-beta-cellobiosidase